MISPQMEQITKAILYDQAGELCWGGALEKPTSSGIVGSSVQVGPDRSWGCASFSSLAAAEQAIHSLHGGDFFGLIRRHATEAHVVSSA